MAMLGGDSLPAPLRSDVASPSDHGTDRALSKCQAEHERATTVLTHREMRSPVDPVGARSSLGDVILTQRHLPAIEG